MDEHTSLFGPYHDPAIKRVDQTRYDQLLSQPGEYPYTRGIHAEMYSQNRFPTVRKYGGFGTAEELNRHLREQIEFGVTGLSIAYDLPTQMGLDPDDPLAEGEVGINGVSIVSLKDYEVAFEGLLKEIVGKGIGVSKTINATAPILLMMYVAAAKKQGVPPGQLRGTIQNDVLKEYLARNTFLYPLAGTLRLVRDVFSYARTQLPKFNTISISGYHMREKGSTGAQELAYMFANAIQYVVTALEAGLKVDDFAPQISFFINIKLDLFQEVAKLRAARRIWAHIMKEGFSAKNPRSHQWRAQAYTGGSDLRREKPHNNITRDAIRTLTAVLGGPQGINTTSFDEAISIPSKLSQGIAIDTAYIVFLEKGVTQAVDPLGGSYYLETKTNELETEVWLELAKIADLSSYQKALSYMSHAIEEEAHREQLAEDLGTKKVVGKNVFTENEDLFPEVEPFQRATVLSSHSAGILQRRALALLKERRDNFLVTSALDQLELAARDPEQNLMPYMLLAVESYATIGEISNRLARVFGVSSSSEPWYPSVSVNAFNPVIRSFIHQKAGERKALNTNKPPNALDSFNALDVPYVQDVHETAVERPGAYPFTRGLTPAAIPWHICKPGSNGAAGLIDAYQYREAGVTASQEVAFGIYKAMNVLDDQKAAHASLEAAADSLALRLSSHNNFFEEIAKFRVARRVWAKLLHERYTLDPERLRLKIHAATSASTLVKEKAWNNIVRTALQALQAALGGVQSLEIVPFDAPFGATEWSEWARQIAIDTHGILLNEISLIPVADPAGGSFYLEALTNQLETAVRTEIERLQEMSREEGSKFIQSVLDGCHAWVEQAKKGDVQVVGVNTQMDGAHPEPKVARG